MDSSKRVTRRTYQGCRCRAGEAADAALLEKAATFAPDAGLSIPEGRARWDVYDMFLGNVRYLR